MKNKKQKKNKIISIFFCFLFFLFFQKNCLASSEKLLLEGSVPTTYSHYYIGTSELGSVCVSTGNGLFYMPSTSTTFSQYEINSYVCDISDTGQYIIANGGNNEYSTEPRNNKLYYSSNYGSSFENVNIFDNSTYNVNSSDVSPNGHYMTGSKVRYQARNSSYGSSSWSYNWSDHGNVNHITYTTKWNNDFTGIESCDTSLWNTTISGNSCSGLWFYNGSIWTRPISNYQIQKADRSDSGSYFCAIALNGDGTNANKIIYATDFPTIESGYFTNNNFYKNCLVADTGLIYLWGDDGTNGNVVVGDLNNPSASFTELIAPSNADISAFNLTCDTCSQYYYAEAGGYIYKYTAETGEGGGTPATSTPITSNFDILEYRAYPTNAYTVSNIPLSDYFIKKRGYNSSIYYMPNETDTWYDSANSTIFDKIRIRMTFSGTATNTTTRVIVDQLDKNYNIIEKDWSWYEYNTTNLIANGWNSVLKDLEPPTEEWTSTSTNANKEYNYAITFYDVDNKKTIKTIMISVIKAPSTWYDQPTENDLNQFDNWENIFGTSTKYTACTIDEWENGNWWTSIKCNTFKTILDIIQSIINGVKTTVNGFINIIKNIFPFNFITKIVNCWNESKLIPRNENLVNILDENNNIYISIPHEWTGNATNTNMVVFGEGITNENEKVNIIFTTIRYLSGPFMWFMFLFGLYYRIKNIIEEIKNNNKE